MQRVLWRSRDTITEFRLITVVYGLASASFLAIRTLNQLADEEKQFPLGGAAERGLRRRPFDGRFLNCKGFRAKAPAGEDFPCGSELPMRRPS